MSVPPLSGHEYKHLIARYLVSEYTSRGLRLFEEVNIGTSIIGKQRRIDLLLIHEPTNRALALECKYQDSAGTADEKIPYTLSDLAALRMPACVVYAGSGFSAGVLHLLQSSELAAYCLPDSDLKAVRRKGELDTGTWQLDHVIALCFGFWDVLTRGRQPLALDALNGLISAELSS